MSIYENFWGVFEHKVPYIVQFNSESMEALRDLTSKREVYPSADFLTFDRAFLLSTTRHPALFLLLHVFVRQCAQYNK